ncbi:unnamed protein product [Enterobius vermicularis]|uniref:DUF2013 domain-containing protein n=1 Tax=Enterobius vermicularis TaxID=51028 RepID=A0A0N4VB20_ENTVE|nr:unnamed protein product [Enterobius vermicularis]
MYGTKLTPKEVARGLVDIAREETDAPIAACATTVNLIILRLMKSITKIEELRSINRAFQAETLLDWPDSYDSRRLDAIIANLEINIEDKEKQSWTLQDDEEDLIEMLAHFKSLLVKADHRVLLKKLDDCEFVAKLVVLYKVEQRSSVQNAVAKSLAAACQLSEKITGFLMSGDLPGLLATSNSFKFPLSKLENSCLRLLQILFSTAKVPPASNLQYITSDFLKKMLDLVGIQDLNALKFLINYNYQFDEVNNPVLDILRANESLAFGHLLISFYNRNHNDEEMCTLKLLYDIYITPKDDLVSKTFYANDLSVLLDVFSQVILDTTVPRKITMILEIFEKMLKRDSPPKEPIYYALKSFINSGSLEESILMKARVLLPPEAHNT